MLFQSNMIFRPVKKKKKKKKKGIIYSFGQISVQSFDFLRSLQPLMQYFVFPLLCDLKKL